MHTHAPAAVRPVTSPAPPPTRCRPQSLVGLLGEEDPDTLGACWEALGAVAASVPKEMQPSFVRCLKVRCVCVCACVHVYKWCAV